MWKKRKSQWNLKTAQVAGTRYMHQKYSIQRFYACLYKWQAMLRPISPGYIIPQTLIRIKVIWSRLHIMEHLLTKRQLKYIFNALLFSFIGAKSYYIAECGLRSWCHPGQRETHDSPPASALRVKTQMCIIILTWYFLSYNKMKYTQNISYYFICRYS